VDKDSNTFVDRQLKKDAKEVADAFQKQFNTEAPGYDVKQIDKEDFAKFVDENFFPFDEEGVLEELVIFFYFWAMP
jgi:hypothetical protein